MTALEANEDVTKLEVVTERILHQERKSNDRSETSSTIESAMTTHRYHTIQDEKEGRKCGILSKK